MKKLFFIFLFITSLIYAEDIVQKVEDISKNLPQVKVTENLLYIKPELQIFLPNGALELRFKETYKKSSLEFFSKYDFVDNFMGFNLNLAYNTKPLLGVSLLDNADFSEIFLSQETINRIQNIGIFSKLNLNKFSFFKISLEYEHNLTTSIETTLKLEQGNNIFGKFLFSNETIKEENGNKTGRNFNVFIKKSIKYFGSDYDYANLDIFLLQYFEILNKQNLEYTFKLGYPLYSNNKPLSEIYYLGGYKMLKGYKFKEFQADSIIYNQFKYNIPIAKSTQLSFIGINFYVLNWNLFLELAKFGTSENIFTTKENIKSSFGSGIEYNFTIFKILPININISLAQSLEYNYPRIYFTIATTYYTYKTE